MHTWETVEESWDGGEIILKEVEGKTGKIFFVMFKSICPMKQYFFIPKQQLLRGSSVFKITFIFKRMLTITLLHVQCFPSFWYSKIL